MKTKIGVEKIAIVCHEANRAYCAALGDLSQVPWAEAPEWQKQSSIQMVEFHLANPAASESTTHDGWLEEKRLAGWKYGPVKDAVAKTHPCIVPFTALPVEQQVKDALFKSVVEAMRRLVETQPPT